MADGVLNPAALLATLAECGVDFVVIGAMAVGVHAEVRATGDVDIMVPVGDEANKAALHRALAELRAAVLPAAAGGVAQDPDDPYPTVMFRTSYGKLDVLYRPDGSAPYGKVRGRAVERVIGGHSVRVAGKDDMVGMKLAAGRPHDLTDVANMTAAEVGDPVKVFVSMHVDPSVNRAWGRDFAAARVGLFDPHSRVRVVGDRLEIQAERADLTEEQLHYWARALADRLHGAGVLADADADVRLVSPA